MEGGESGGQEMVCLPLSLGAPRFSPPPHPTPDGLSQHSAAGILKM